MTWRELLVSPYLKAFDIDTSHGARALNRMYSDLKVGHGCKLWVQIGSCVQRG
jgi:hypothetical protein